MGRIVEKAPLRALAVSDSSDPRGLSLSGVLLLLFFVEVVVLCLTSSSHSRSIRFHSTSSGMAESTLAAKVANLDMGTPINGHEFLLLPLPHVEIKQEDLEGGPESDSQGGEARTAEVEWLTTECDLTADPQFESFLRALQQLSFSKVSLNMGNFLSFYNEAETGYVCTKSRCVAT